MRELDVLIASRKEMVIGFLEILRSTGYSQKVGCGKLFRAVCRKFGVYVARCKDCDKYLDREAFPHWSSLPPNILPRYYTRMSCGACLKAKRVTDPCRESRTFAVVIPGMLLEYTFHVAARNKREAFKLVVTSDRNRRMVLALDPTKADIKAMTYDGRPVTIRDLKKEKARG
jgi:hypothetical protein